MKKAIKVCEFFLMWLAPVFLLIALYGERRKREDCDRLLDKAVEIVEKQDAAIVAAKAQLEKTDGLAKAFARLSDKNFEEAVTWFKKYLECQDKQKLNNSL